MQLIRRENIKRSPRIMFIFMFVFRQARGGYGNLELSANDADDEMRARWKVGAGWGKEFGAQIGREPTR